MYELPAGVVTAGDSPAYMYNGASLALASFGDTVEDVFRGWTTAAAPDTCWSTGAVVSTGEPLTVGAVELYFGGLGTGAGYSTAFRVANITYFARLTRTETWELQTGYENPSTPNASACYLTQDPGSTSAVKLVVVPWTPQDYAAAYGSFDVYTFGMLCLCGVVTYPTYAAAAVVTLAGVVQRVDDNYPVANYMETTYMLASLPSPTDNWTIQDPAVAPSTAAWLTSQVGDGLTMGFTYSAPIAGDTVGFGVYLGVGELPDNDLPSFTTLLALYANNVSGLVSWADAVVMSQPVGTEWTFQVVSSPVSALSITLHTRTPSTVLYISGVIRVSDEPLQMFSADLLQSGPIQLQAIKLQSSPSSPAGPAFAPSPAAPTDVTVTEVVPCVEYTITWVVDDVTAAQVATWSLQCILGDTTPFVTALGTAREVTVVSQRPRPHSHSPRPQYIMYGTTLDGQRTPSSVPSTFVPCVRVVSCTQAVSQRRRAWVGNGR